MNHLFALPLHGVCCVPYCEASEVEHSHEITLAQGNVTLPLSLKPLWTLTDEGERYQSEITLYTQDISQQTDTPQPTEVDKNLPLHSEYQHTVYYLKINCQGHGLFKLHNNHITIDWQEQGTDAAHYFQTMAVALYLELKNVLCLHANALVYQNRTIALVAPSRTGKTTLTAALSKVGFALMTDDMIALHKVQAEKDEQHYQVYPSWPVARMWPDALESLQGSSSEQHKKVHEQFDKRIVNITPESGFNFCSQPKPLNVIYLLNRLPEGQLVNNSDNCEVVPIAKAKAIILLLQNSMLGSCYRALGIEQSRVKALCELLNDISFKQINYSSGKKHLSDVGELIKRDVQLG